MKKNQLSNSLLSTRKRTILKSSRTVLDAMIAMHIHRQLWLIILLLSIREKVNTGELFSLLWKVWKRSIILTVSFQLENVPFNIQSYSFECNDAMHVQRQYFDFTILWGIFAKLSKFYPFSGVRKNIKLMEHKYVIHHFKASGYYKYIICFTE